MTKTEFARALFEINEILYADIPVEEKIRIKEFLTLRLGSFISADETGELAEVLISMTIGNSSMTV